MEEYVKNLNEMSLERRNGMYNGWILMYIVQGTSNVEIAEKIMLDDDKDELIKANNRIKEEKRIKISKDIDNNSCIDIRDVELYNKCTAIYEYIESKSINNN